MDIAIVTFVLIVAMVLLITEIVPVDITSIGIIVTLILCGILSPAEAIAGFASPAVITVGAMFLISKGMVRTGTVEFVAQNLLMYSRGHSFLALLLVLSIVGLSSAFINNTAVVVLFVPIVLNICCMLGLSPSKFLIPVSYASILAGTCTLIGTSTNIIISDLTTANGMEALGMFELSKLGVPIALLGCIFLVTIGHRMMPSINSPICELDQKSQRRYLAEFRVKRSSPFIGQDPASAFASSHPGIEVIELIRYSHIFYPGRDTVQISPHDLLLVKGSANDLLAVLNEDLVALPTGDPKKTSATASTEAMVVELIIPPNSALLGQKLVDSGLRRNPDIHVIAIQRGELHYTEQNLQHVRLKLGDILLIRCSDSTLQLLRGESDYIIVEDIHHEIVHKRLARRAFSIFGGMVVAAAAGMADIMVCALAAALLMVLSGCLQLRDAYRAIEGRVLLIIIGTFALSAALEKTGASAYYTRLFLGMFADLGPHFVLCGIILLTSISTQVLSNNATAILILPIAISAAVSLGVNPRPFIIGVCFGASACFATPIGYQTNLLVYGPGGYRFSDFLKLGIPLNILVVALSSLFIPYIWTF